MSHSHPVGATVEKPIPILSCTDLGIMSQGNGDFSLKDLGINRNLSHMLGHLLQQPHVGETGFPPIWIFSHAKRMALRMVMLVNQLDWSVDQSTTLILSQQLFNGLPIMYRYSWSTEDKSY